MKFGKKVSPFIFSLVFVLGASLVLSGCEPENPTEETGDNNEEQTGSICNFTQAEFEPTTRGEQLLHNFFYAINNGHYETAFNMLSDDMKASYGKDVEGNDVDPLENFTQVYSAHVQCVQIVGMEDVSGQAAATGDLVSASLGLVWYRVTFEATYIQPFDAGSGELPMFYKTQCDPHADQNQPGWGEIISIATGI